MNANPLALLIGLIELTSKESTDGKFRVTLEFDNYQDGALVKDGNGKVIGECYDSDKCVELQFLTAIDRAIASTPKSNLPIG